MAVRPFLALAAITALAVAAHACGSYGEDDSTSSALGDGGGDPMDATTADGTSTVPEAASDAGSDAASGCLLDSPFGAPEPIENTESFGAVSSMRLDRSGALALLSMDLGNPDGFDVREVEFPVAPSALPYSLRSTIAQEQFPAPLADNRKVFFDQSIDGGFRRIFSATRSSPGQNLSSPMEEQIPRGARTHSEMPWAASGKEILYLVLRDAANDTADIHRAVRANSAWTVTPEITGPFDETHPVVSDDERVMYFASNGGGRRKIFVTTRAAPSDPWPSAVEIQGAISLPDADDEPSWISPDGCTLFFTSNRSGALKPYRVVRTKN